MPEPRAYGTDSVEAFSIKYVMSTSRLRAVILTDRRSAVSRCETILTAALGLDRRASCDGGCVVRGDNVEIEVREAPPWLAWVRRARNARNPLGALAALGAGDAGGVPLATLARVAANVPTFAANVPPAAARGSLREVVLSSAGVEAAAAAFRAAAARAGAASPAPGVSTFGGVDWRVQPLSAGATALVFRTESVDAAAERLSGYGIASERVGVSGSSPGQLLVGMPWAGGIEIRLCESPDATPFFQESFSSIVDAPGVLPDLQSASLSGKRDAAKVAGDDSCWSETHAVLRRPLEALRANV